MIDQIIEYSNKKLPHSRLRSVLLHTIFWFVWISRTLFDVQELWGWHWSLVYISLLFVCQAPLVYCHLYLLVPKFLNKKKYVLYILLTCISLYTYSVLFYSVLKLIQVDSMPAVMLRFLNRIDLNFDVLEGLIVILLTYALKYTLIAFITQNELLRLQKEKLELELNALKSQIHPHFLFNTLNNLYSLTLKNSNKASEVVLKLSDIMRYVLYQANEQKVSLESEIDFIQNYVDLQRIRYSTKYTIEIEINGEYKEQKIAPLLFIDFVENAFKHGLEKRFNDGIVKVKFDFNEEKVNMQVINTKGNQEAEITIRPNRNSGIGLNNVRRRLDLIYGSKHQLEIEDQEEYFIINLEVNLV